MYNLIYDIGANRGQNLKYYLSKSKYVLAVEANQVLAEDIYNRFFTEIEKGRLILVNKCLTNIEGGGYTDFYINLYSSGLSRSTPPKIHPEDFRIIQVPQISYGELVNCYGKPDLVKLDLEGFDKVVINYMLKNNLLPPYIQFENCGIDTIENIVASGFYNSWNIVSQYNLKKTYGKKMSSVFSNPIDEDIISPWLNSSDIIDLYKKMPHSWFDIHAKINGENSNQIFFGYYKKPFSLMLLIKKMIPHKFKAIVKRSIRWGK